MSATPDTDTQPPILALCLPALHVVTPSILRDVSHAVETAGATPLCADIQIVLAEALNNVVEHAYDNRGDGTVALRVDQTNAGVQITLTDWGRAFAGNTLPAGATPDPQTMAEGGYGWFMIRALVSEIRHTRTCCKNQLFLTFKA